MDKQPCLVMLTTQKVAVRNQKKKKKRADPAGYPWISDVSKSFRSTHHYLLEIGHQLWQVKIEDFDSGNGNEREFKRKSQVSLLVSVLRSTYRSLSSYFLAHFLICLTGWFVVCDHPTAWKETRMALPAFD